MGDIAAEYVEAGKQNLHKFQPPKVSFVFFDGVTESVSGELMAVSIIIPTNTACISMFTAIICLKNARALHSVLCKPPVKAIFFRIVN